MAQAALIVHHLILHYPPPVKHVQFQDIKSLIIINANKYVETDRCYLLLMNVMMAIHKTEMAAAASAYFKMDFIVKLIVKRRN